MSLQRPTEEKKPFTTSLEAGEHEGRLIHVVDLGKHEEEYKGEKKPDRQKIALGFELLGQTVTIDGEVLPVIIWAKPFNIYATMTDKGKELEYYSTFDAMAEAGQVPDWEAQLGKPVSVVVKQEKSGDNVYANLHSISPIPAKYQADLADSVTAPSMGNIDETDSQAYKNLNGLARWIFNNRIQGKVWSE